MPFEVPQVVSGGTIRTSRFVKLSTAADNTILECDANEQCIGVSTEAAQDAPIPGASTDAAAAGDQCAMHPIGSVCLVQAGDAITRGDKLKSDADGKAVPAATTGTTVQWVNGRALESASADELVKIVVESYPFRPALV